MPSIVKQIESDGNVTTKYVWKLEDNTVIESVLLRFDHYDSLCVSSQAGCSLGCTFCATAKGGLVRNLSRDEIVAQVVDMLDEIGVSQRQCEVSFMGMGEPLLNLKAIMGTWSYLRFQYPGLAYGLSTVGIVPKIYKLASFRTDIQLQISLHAPNNCLRQKLMPVTNQYPIGELLAAAIYYARTCGKDLYLNYLLLDNCNDSDECAHQLVSLLQNCPKDIQVHLKLATFNRDPGLEFAPASDKQCSRFEAICRDGGLKVYRFRSMGVSIGGGCGQLRARTIKEMLY